MDNMLFIITKNAEDLANSSAELAEKIKTITLQSSNQLQGDIDPLTISITIFILSCIIGYYIVWQVTPALHTPLMSITNAISGIIVIGALISCIGNSFGIASFLGTIAIFLASINIFGGFIVTERMLEMFKKIK